MNRNGWNGTSALKMQHRWTSIGTVLVVLLLANVLTMVPSGVTGYWSGKTERPYPVSQTPLESPLIGPFVDKIRFEVLAGDETQVEALLADEIDLIGDNIDPSYLPHLDASEHIEIITKLRNGYGYLTINCRKYPLNITALRRAAAFAFDKELVSTDVWDGLAVPQDSVVPQVNPFSIEGQLPYSYYEADVDMANTLLDEAGFLDIDSDDYREAPNGSDFVIKIETASSSSIAIETGNIMEDALQAIGINATNVVTDFYSYLTRLYSHGDYDMAFMGSSFSSLDVDWLGYEYWSENADEPERNFPNFRNVTYDSYREALLHSVDYEEIYTAASNMQEIL
ncbi:hypothetical protein EU538_12155, partial [Candidatus Thorarchaeota archaeon]